MKEEKAWNNFLNFAPTYRKMYIYQVSTTKTMETLEKRIAKSVERIAKTSRAGCSYSKSPTISARRSSMVIMPTKWPWWSTTIAMLRPIDWSLWKASLTVSF